MTAASENEFFGGISKGTRVGEMWGAVARFIQVEVIIHTWGFEALQAPVATAPRSLIVLHIFSWFEGVSKLSFKLSNLLPGVSQACAGSSP